MSKTLAKYWAIFKTQLVHSLSYPADLLSRSLTIVLFLWIFPICGQRRTRAPARSASRGSRGGTPCGI